jgi:hypothetical protein
MRPVVVSQRHFGFFDILKQKLKEEVEKNEDFRNKVKTAQETEALKKASEAAAATKVGTGSCELLFFLRCLKYPCRRRQNQLLCSAPQLQRE